MAAPDSDRLDVLVVDDNDVNRMLVRRQLEKLQARATCVENAADAVAVFTAQSFDVVLLDCRLPQVDGFQVARRLREVESRRHGRRTPIVALTAATEPGLRSRVDAAGMDDLLHKPASLGDLRGVLLRWAGDRQDSAYPVDPGSIDRLLEEIESPGAVRALVETYLQQLPARRAGLCAAIRRGDAEAIGALAQELRSSGESIGAVRLGRICQELETAARAGTPVAEDLVPRIEETTEATLTALHAVLGDAALRSGTVR